MYIGDFVSMPSRANASLLPFTVFHILFEIWDNVSMPSRANASLLRSKIQTDYTPQIVSMPSRANASLLRKPRQPPTVHLSNVSMPSRANASLLQYPFKNLGFMRFPEPVFAGICQNILTVTHFHAC